MTLVNELTNLTEKDVYSAQLAALAYNYSEGLYEEGFGEQQHGKMLVSALNKAGYPDLDLEKVNLTLNFYLSPDSPVSGKCVDITSLPEYEQEMPELY